MKWLAWWTRGEQWILLIMTLVSHNILIDKLMKYRLDKWTVRLIENWLNIWTQRVVIWAQTAAAGKSLVVYLRGWYWAQYCSTPSLMTWRIGQSSLQQVCKGHKTGSGCYIKGVCCHAEGPWTGWKMGMRGVSWSLTRENAKSCLWGGIILGMSTHWRLNGWKTPLQRRIWGPGGQQIVHEPAMYLHGKKGQEHAGLH